MTHIHRNAILPYPDHKMFDLVNDVARYPEYLEGCVSAEIHEQSDSLMVATLGLEKRGIRMQFTTRNTLDERKAIIMTLEEGPFTDFEGRWFFQHLNDDACKVILDLQFVLSNKIHGLAMQKLFDSVSNNMVDAMVKRAKKIYG